MNIITIVQFASFFLLVSGSHMEHIVKNTYGNNKDTRNWDWVFQNYITNSTEIFNINSKLPTVQESDITYYFYNQSNTTGESIKYNETSTIFDSNKETLILIHGWTDSRDSDFNVLIKNATLENYDINIIVVDWSTISKNEYIIVTQSLPEVGKYIGYFFLNLTSVRNVSLSDIKIVGHSLGAHLAGMVGTALSSLVNYIVGLDPASPFINQADLSYCLDKSDAQFVQVIHTSGGKLGILNSLGHADYFPNGGSDQPGCILDVVGSCAHKRAFEYFAESIRNNQFYAEECNSYNDFTTGDGNGTISLMGGYYLNKTLGNYYLETNTEPPYGKGTIEE